MAAGMIQSLVEFVERNIGNGTEEGLMRIHTQVLDRIDEATKKHETSNVDLQPVKEANIMAEVKCADKAIVVSSSVDSATCLATVEGDGIKTTEVNNWHEQFGRI